MDNNEFNWDEAISLAHKTAVEHGFWDDKHVIDDEVTGDNNLRN